MNFFKEGRFRDPVCIFPRSSLTSEEEREKASPSKEESLGT